MRHAYKSKYNLNRENQIILLMTENKLKKHKNVCENHDYCYVEMSKKDNKILKYNHGVKYMKVIFIIYADVESLPEKKTLVIIILKNNE